MVVLMLTCGAVGYLIGGFTGAAIGILVVPAYILLVIVANQDQALWLFNVGGWVFGCLLVSYFLFLIAIFVSVVGSWPVFSAFTWECAVVVVAIASVWLRAHLRARKQTS